MAAQAVMGRPSDYSESLADYICTRLAGGESLRMICAQDDMPDRSTIFRWIMSHETFATKYARARESQAEFHYDEMDRLEQAVEDGSLDSKAGSVILGNKRWRLEKLKPKVYGSKQAIEHTGKDGGPIQTQSEVRPQLTREEWLATYVDAPARPAASSD